ncbi:MAG: hypothetical protein IT585_04970 [candidate division Zixibacteria bacterium]|nr:hypothetical protein [candidate division Zixibacteria bacterium]
MTRKITVLLTLALFLIALGGASVFAAKAVNSATAGSTQYKLRTDLPAAKIVGAEEVSPADYTGSGKPATSNSQVLGFSPNGTRTVGSTYLDYQHNGSMGRQIVVGGGWVHNAWMVYPTASTTGDRYIEYFGYSLTSGSSAGVPSVDPATTGSGYCNIDYDPLGSGGAVVAYHRVAENGTKATHDFSNGAAAFANHFVFPAPNCQSVVSGLGGVEGPYIWPIVALDIIGGQAVLHAVSTESPPNTSDNEQSIVYYRSNAGITASATTCAYWIDSCWNITPVVAADPNSDKVAVVYLRPKDHAFSSGTQQHNNQVVYIESTNGGTSWGPRVNVSNYTGATLERAYTDVDALYTADGCLHIAWNAPPFDSAGGGASSNDVCKLRHWDNCAQCLSLVAEANNVDDNADNGAWNLNIAKMNLTECTVGANKVLYLTYTRFLGTTASPDRSAANFSNGEIFAQASSTLGQTWGPPVNLTNTPSNGCAAGACFSEHWSSSARYVTDSLRIQYIEDKDAGGIVQTEGGWTNSPVKNLSVGCFPMTTFVNLSASPAEFSYPFHVAPATTKDSLIVLTNSGNASTNWTVSATVPWISFPGGAAGTCNAGCTNTSSFTARFSPGAGGYLTGTINVTYTDPDKGVNAVTAIPVELYSFANFFLPQDLDIRTSCARMNVNQASQIAANVDGKRFSYFADLPSTQQGYMYDGFLILGNSATNLTHSTFRDIGGTGITEPSGSNPFGFLYAATAAMTGDSTTFANERRATGKGYNRDSTLQFDVRWFAPKIPDSCNFFVGVFDIYKGPKAGAVNNLTVAYYADWDVPSDTGSDNYSGVDAAKYMVYQRGGYPGGTANNINRYGALGGAIEGGKIVGGFVVDNPTYIYPSVGWENDTLWNRLSILAQDQYQTAPGFVDPGAGTGPAEDLSSVLVLARGKTVATAADTVTVAVVVAGQPVSGGTLAGLKATLDRGYKFICVRNLLPGAQICATCKCGDADNSGAWSISDAVYLINYIFAGGPAPAQTCLGDADGSKAISISDAVYLINYIFAGGPAPAGC